jgi:hypothetical protein
MRFEVVDSEGKVIGLITAQTMPTRVDVDFRVVEEGQDWYTHHKEAKLAGDIGMSNSDGQLLIFYVDGDLGYDQTELARKLVHAGVTALPAILDNVRETAVSYEIEKWGEKKLPKVLDLDDRPFPRRVPNKHRFRRVSKLHAPIMDIIADVEGVNKRAKIM